MWATLLSLCHSALKHCLANKLSSLVGSRQAANSHSKGSHVSVSGHKTTRPRACEQDDAARHSLIDPRNQKVFVYLVLCLQCAGGNYCERQPVRAVKRHAGLTAEDNTTCSQECFQQAPECPAGHARAAIHAVTCPAASVRALQQILCYDFQADRARDREPADT
jgi:hypothetical protein